MAGVHHTISDPSGWSFDIYCEDSGIRGVFGVVYSVTIVNNSTYTIHVWLDYKGDRLTGTATPGTNVSIDMVPFNVLQGEVTQIGVY